MSWLFSQALVEEYSAGTCLDGAPCAQLNVMPTPQPFWHNGKMIDASSHSQFGPTFAPLTESRGAGVLMSFLAAFPAKILAVPGKGLGLEAAGQAFGVKWPGSLAKLDRDSCSWRTPQCSLFEDSEPSLETWPRWGLMRDGECWEVRNLVPRTAASAFGLLPTLTLITCEHPGRVKIKPGQQVCTSSELAKRDAWKAGGKYSPSHAAWFMGWPESWTSLDRLAMGKYRKWQQLHFPSCAQVMIEAA